MSGLNNRGIITRMQNSTVPFVALLSVIVLLAAAMLYPLIRALTWAAILSFFTYPFYKFLLDRVFHCKYRFIAAALNTLVILFVIVIPIVGAGFALTREAAKLYAFFVDWYPGTGELTLEQFMSLPQLQWFTSILPSYVELPTIGEIFSSITGILATFITRMSRELLGNALRLAYTLLVITVSSFFFTLDGHRIVGFIRDVLPLSGQEKEMFFLRARQMLYSIFYGVILTAAIQGLLGAVGWRFVGLANATLFGSLMFFLAMLPFVGTPIVWIPGVIYLFFTNDAKNGIILLLWGIFVVSSIDNLLRPIFISEGSRVHILLVFTGILGGITTWGFLGIFLGPLIMSMAYFMLQLYRYVVISPVGEEPLPPGEGDLNGGDDSR